jgi:hypothetical protein
MVMQFLLGWVCADSDGMQALRQSRHRPSATYTRDAPPEPMRPVRGETMTRPSIDNRRASWWRSRTRRIADLLVAAALVASVLGACVTSAGPVPSTCAAPSVEVALVLAPDALTPNDPRACRGQNVVLAISAEADGVFHIHGYDDTIPATTVIGGEETRLEFEAVRAGQFPIEFHPADDPQGVELGIFTVHEP